MVHFVVIEVLISSLRNTKKELFFALNNYYSDIGRKNTFKELKKIYPESLINILEILENEGKYSE